MLEALASNVREVVSMVLISNNFSGNFFRVRILCDVRKPPTPNPNNASMIREKKRHIFLVKYERQSDSCAFCGMIVYLGIDHVDGIHPP
jgi:hypothetical protein